MVPARVGLLAGSIELISKGCWLETQAVRVVGNGRPVCPHSAPVKLDAGSIIFAVGGSESLQLRTSSTAWSCEGWQALAATRQVL